MNSLNLMKTNYHKISIFTSEPIKRESKMKFNFQITPLCLQSLIHKLRLSYETWETIYMTMCAFKWNVYTQPTGLPNEGATILNGYHHDSLRGCMYKYIHASTVQVL